MKELAEKELLKRIDEYYTPYRLGRKIVVESGQNTHIAESNV